MTFTYHKIRWKEGKIETIKVSKCEGIPGKWDEKCFQSFEQLKQKLVSSPVLGFPISKSHSD